MLINICTFISILNKYEELLYKELYNIFLLKKIIDNCTCKKMMFFL